jgi:hypothetical protein
MTGQRLCAKHCPFLVVFEAQRSAVYTRLPLFWLIQGVAGIHLEIRMHLNLLAVIPGNLRLWISSDLNFTVMLLQCLTVFFSSYIMSLVGLNLTAQNYQWLDNNPIYGPPVSSFTLSPDKLDAAIAQTVAQLTWMGRESYKYVRLCYHLHCVTNSAGQVGRIGGILPGEGTALAYEDVTALRLNVSINCTEPLSF